MRERNERRVMERTPVTSEAERSRPFLPVPTNSYRVSDFHNLEGGADNIFRDSFVPCGCHRRELVTGASSRQTAHLSRLILPSP